MKTFVRAGLATLVAVALTLAATAAFAIEYDDVVGLTKQGVSDRTIVELIVKDGRAFEMNEDEIAGLRDEDVSEDVIQAMLDPSYGQDWLDGKITGDDDQYYDDNGDDSNGYSTSLDRAYGQGYNDGRSTALVYSFGYYYGPLARYYYCDPFYYPFWYSGLYQSSYWPSYCAFYYRPAYSWYGAYPYNYYNYDSYYCYTWYDPGYYASRGYSVRPGSGRTIWDNGPRWRDGGLPPSGNGNVNRDPLITRLADHREGRPAAPPIIRDLLTRNSGGGGRDLVSGTRNRDGRVTREVAPVIRPVPGDRTVGDRIVRSGDRGNGRVIRGPEPVTRPVAPGRIARDGTMRRGDEAGRMVREGRAPRIEPGRGDVVRRSDGRVPVRRGPDLRGQDRRAPDGRGIDRGSFGRRNTDGGRSYDPSRRIERAPETRGESRQAPPARGNYQRPDRGGERRSSERAVESQPERQPEVRNNDGGQRPAEEKKADAAPEQPRGERVTGMLGGRR